MNEILVNFVLQTDTNVEVKIPEDMIVEDALEQLVESDLINALGANMEWFVAFKESGQVVDISKTMAENGITDGTALRVAQNGKAGA